MKTLKNLILVLTLLFTLSCKSDGQMIPGIGQFVCPRASTPAANQLWVAVGGGGSNYIMTSPDGINWTARGMPVGNNIANSIAYNGSKWVMACENRAGGNSLAYSSDAINWTGLGSTLYTGYSVVWNGTIWLAGGSAITHSVVYSYNVTDWTGENKTVINIPRAFAWNGSIFYAVGQSTSFKYSSNGTSWTSVTGGLNTGYGIAYGGGVWVAVGDGTNSIVYSTNGTSWTGVTGKTVFSTKGNGVAWNGSYFVAVGEGTNAIATSPDGINWTARSITGTSKGNCVAWNGTMWMIGGSFNGGYYPVATSTNGINWTLGGYNCGLTSVNSIACSVAPNLYPSIP